ncbi:hypothetical protein L0E34_27410, partial [Klebsiella pneumoniae]|nr:hypothetical protein [Klebsiella pneumoniae]
GPQNDVTLKMPAFEWVHVQLHQQKGMISLSPPTICNSANEHGRQQLSRARFTACHLPWTDDGDCACLSPGEWTQTGDTAPGERSRHPPQRRRARARNGVALQSAGSFIAGTVKAARPERSQQALPLTLTSDIRH